MMVEQKLNKHLQDNWRVSKWWLDRKYSREYGKRIPLPPRDPDSDEEIDPPDRIIWTRTPNTPSQTGVKGLENAPILTLDQILEEENRVWALEEIPAVERQPGADLDTLAMEMENRQPIAVQAKVAKDTGKAVQD